MARAAANSSSEARYFSLPAKCRRCERSNFRGGGGGGGGYGCANGVATRLGCGLLTMTNGMISQIWHWASLHSIMHGLWKPGTSVTPVYDRMDSRFRGNDEKRNVAHWVPLVGKRMEARMDSRLHGNDGKRPPLSPPRKEGDMKEGSRALLPLLLSFPRKRESIFAWQGGGPGYKQTDWRSSRESAFVCLPSASRRMSGWWERACPLWFHHNINPCGQTVGSLGIGDLELKSKETGFNHKRR